MPHGDKGHCPLGGRPRLGIFCFISSATHGYESRRRSLSAEHITALHDTSVLVLLLREERTGTQARQLVVTGGAII